MTINKYYVLVPKACDKQEQSNHQTLSEKETHRQQTLKQAQVEGGLAS
ncbi:hypothetical protein L4C33_11860 [Vibrio makurazakiensis]